MSREFNLGTLSSSGRTNLTFDTKPARSDSFYVQQKFAAKSYDAQAFEAKRFRDEGAKFAARDASTKGKYEVPNVAKAADAKTAPTHDARESGKLMATRDLPDGGRPYLGQEATRMKTPLDPTNLPKITNSMEELKTVEDMRRLLNKN